MTRQNMQTTEALSTVTARLSSVSVKQLPSLILPITRLLSDCGQILSRPESQFVKGSPDALSLHKLKTQVIALLSDKSAEGRYSANLLIRTIIDAGGHEQLQKAASWVRGLVTILGRPTDPPASKKLALVTLTRIFLLTHDYQTLTREITTPTLPAYITACLTIVAPKTPPSKPAQLLAQHILLEPILESFALLVPNHPNIFRTFLSQINALIAPLLAPTPSSPSASQPFSSLQVSAATISAQRLFTLLPICAPKQSNSTQSSSTTTNTQSTTRPLHPSSAAWHAALESNVSAIHMTADLLFRAVHETWRSAAGVIPQSQTPQIFNGPLEAPDAVNLALPKAIGSGLPGWSGVHAGGERMVGLLDLLRSFIEGQTAATIVLPVASIVDILARIMNVVAPAAGRGRDKKHRGQEAYNMRVNDAISRDERLGLWAEVPAIHTAACEVVEALLIRLGPAALPVADTLLENLLWVLGQGAANAMLREAAYGALTELIEIAGASYTRDTVRALDGVVRVACGDMLPGLADPQKASENKDRATANGAASSAKKSETSINADALFKSPGGEHGYQSAFGSVSNTQAEGLLDAAHDFVVTYTAIIPARHMSAITRTVIDRTAILANDAEAMLASVVNPPHNAEGAPKSRSSILPHLARAFPERLEVEALLRPRMPLVHAGQQDADNNDTEEEPEEPEQEEDEDAAEDQADKMETEETIPVVAQRDPFAPAEATPSALPWTLPSATSGNDTNPSDYTASDIRPSTLGKRNVSDTSAAARLEEKRRRVREPDVPAQAAEPASKPIVSAPSSVPALLDATDQSDDDDNFVIPALTLEQDTEDEDEDDDEGGEEDDDGEP